jgi:two-component system sensor histidine kinase KdpD
MDVRMPGMDGIETTRRLKVMDPSMGVVALTGMEEQHAVRDMLVAGAAGYVLKDADGDEILDAVLRAATGGAVLSPDVTPSVIGELTEALERERLRTRQLEVAQDALLERAARRQQLVGRLGHELRTPVTVILGLARTLQRQPFDGSGSAEVLGILAERTEALARLVERLEAAVEAGLTEWANVTDLVDEVAAAHPRVQVDGPGVAVMTTLNRTAGMRILLELVENALAFSPPEEPVLVRVTADEDHVEVRVVDHGSGVDPSTVSRIFDPLEQGEDLLTRTHPGAGWGLSLARLSAHAMDGDVTLETTGPDGSVFLWRLADAAVRLVPRAVTST